MRIGGDGGGGGGCPMLDWDKIDEKRCGPNAVLSLMAREATGKLPGGMNRQIPILHRLQQLTGPTLYKTIDNGAGGICTEVSLLRHAISSHNWSQTAVIVSRLAPRLSGDQNSLRPAPPPPNSNHNNHRSHSSSNNRNDPVLPPNTSRYHCGGDRIGLERDAFIHCGGIPLLIDLFL